MTEVILPVVVEIHPQRFELWTSRAKSREESKIKEGIVVQDQLLDSDDLKSAMSRMKRHEVTYE
jgi:hypothetical protein